MQSSHLNWKAELGSDRMARRCEAYLRGEGIACYALLQNETEGPQRRDGIFDVRIPNEQFSQDLRVFKLICRANTLISGDRFFNDIKHATLRSYDRNMTAIVVTTRSPAANIVHFGETAGVAVIDAQGLRDFAAALTRLKAGNAAAYEGPSAVLLEALQLQSEKNRQAQELEELAFAATHSSDWAAAEAYLQKSIKIAGGTAFTHIALAEALSAQARHQDAERVLDNASGLFMNRMHILAAKAVVAETRGDLPEAILRWKEVIRRFPSNWAGYRGNIAALRKSALNAEADAFLRTHAPDFPNDIHALFDIVVFSELKREWPAVEAACRICVAMSAPVPWAHTRLARALREQGKLEEAEGSLLEAIGLFPNRPEFPAALGQLQKAHDAAACSASQGKS